MFGHLKAEDFTNLIEGIAIRPRRQAHLEKCARCAREWKAVEAIHMAIADHESDGIIEPDWSEFRASVRDEMLSRSARRSVETRRWSAWKLAPAGVSLAAALGAGVALTHYFGPEVVPPDLPGDSEIVVESAFSVFDSLDQEAAVWVSVSAWDDVITLSPEESERFRELLENETRQITPADAPAPLEELTP